MNRVACIQIVMSLPKTGQHPVFKVISVFYLCSNFEETKLSAFLVLSLQQCARVHG